MIQPIRSPFFYVGDKYKLMSQLENKFPENINTFIEPFVGGGSVFLNTSAHKYKVNDLENNIINLHKLFYRYKNQEEIFMDNLIKLIEMYELSFSFIGKTVPDELKAEYPKTYYAKYNKENYIQMRKDYNENKNDKLLFLLLIYGFNHMIRFNKKGEFNIPVGNVDFNSNVYKAIHDYFDFLEKNSIDYYNLDYTEFIKKIKIQKNDFIYFDPPYLLSNSEYNKMWDEEEEERLYKLIDYLDENNIKFGLSNLVKRRGKENTILSSWMSKYDVYDIKSNYISYFDNTIEKNNREVYITNVKS